MRISVIINLVCVVLLSASKAPALQAQHTSADGGTQRILPLPQGKMSDFQTQMELLRRLRELVTNVDDSNRSESASPDSQPEISGQQLEQLQKALKQFQNQLPPNVTPPDLGLIPKEQLDQAMSNPAVQQQLKQMLEQFSRDGILPQDETGTVESPLPPFPQPKGKSKDVLRRRENSKASSADSDSLRPDNSILQPRGNSPSSNSPDVRSGNKSSPERNLNGGIGANEDSDKISPSEKSWQSLKDAMKKLSQIAQGETPESQQDALPHSPSSETANGQSTPFPGAGRGNDSRANQQRALRKVPSPNSADSIFPQPDDVSERRQESLEAFQELLERYKKSQEEQPNQAGEQDSPAEDRTLPQIEPGGQSVQPPRDRANRESELGKGVPPLQPPNSGQRAGERGEDTTVGPPQVGSTPSGDLGNSQMPSIDPRKPPTPVSEFLKQQLSNEALLPGKSSELRQQRGGGNLDSSGTEKKVDQSTSESGNSVGSENMPESSIDTRSELEKRGLKATLQKIVERARKEAATKQTQAEQQRSNDTTVSPGVASNQDSGEKNSDDSGLAGPLGRLLGGLDQRMDDIVKDAKFRDVPSNSKSNPGTAEYSPTPDSQSPSWNSAVSGFLKDLSTAPREPSAEALSPSVNGSSSMTPESPWEIGSFLGVGIGLLVLLAIILALIRRPLLQMVSVATGYTMANPIHSPDDIRSREDVIVAFHQLAMGSKQLVESWWTHRVAAQTLAAASPKKEVAVRTLAEIYEKARYLPADAELPAETIQSARSALAQCR